MLADQRHSVPTFQFQSQPTQATPVEDVGELPAIQKDLTKTIILAVLAIGVELLIFFEGR